MEGVLTFDNISLVSVLLAFFIGLGLTMIVIPNILLIAKKKRLFDISNERKVHKGDIPRLAGVSFMPLIIFSSAFAMALRYLLGFDPGSSHMEVSPEVLMLICSTIALYLVGITDDLVGVRYRQKFLVQIICAAFMIASGLWINDFYGFFGIHELSPWLGIPLTVLLVVLIINSINLIDGIDGLASGLSIIALAVFGIFFLIHDLFLYSLVSFSSLGVLISFFYYNVFGNPKRGRKIFMGDTGSLTIGIILSFCAVRISMVDPALAYPFKNGGIIAFSLLIVPVFDVIHVVFHRLKKGSHPFKPDKNHIHHRFLAMGFSPRRSLVMILLISMLYCAGNIILINHINITLLVLLDGAVWIAILLFIDRRIAVKKADASPGKI